ncbi:hypothetical protein, partial [Bacteriovorax sp. BSW11_IV]|uniref:hypothetical protein n=1 Tax=Bacteriovorax sp. BSW11_IV TaxID=1353529 RepID=UPI000552E702
MRTYLIDEEKNDVIIDLTKVINHSSELVEFHYQTITDNKVDHKNIVYIRKLCGQFFASNDNKSWRKVPKQDLPRKVLNVNKVYDVYRGYK